ncbi:hypothetical protein [Citrobacter pasteurii]|nr:hypothetical protein [Citrobacter pasteurii]
MWCSNFIHVFAVSRLTLPARDPLLSSTWLTLYLAGKNGLNK